MRASSTPLSFRMADPDRVADLEAMDRWASDDSIRHLYQVGREEQYRSEGKNRKTAIQTRLRQVYSEGREVYLIQVESCPVGSVSLALHAHELSFDGSLCQLVGSVWLWERVTIGDRG